MPKLIDSEKLLEWLRNSKTIDWYFETPLAEQIDEEIQSGTFDPTQVQPDTPNPGDRVQHTAKDKNRHGKGTILEIKGKSACVKWDDSEIVGLPQLRCLEVIK